MLAHTIFEPWESGYLLFVGPGLIGWIFSVVWWIRRREKLLPLAAQLIFAFEVAIGAGVAYAKGIHDISSWGPMTGGFDPSVLYSDHKYIAEVALIGGAVHGVLLTITIILAVATLRRIKYRQNKTQEDKRGIAVLLRKCRSAFEGCRPAAWAIGFEDSIASQA